MKIFIHVNYRFLHKFLKTIPNIFGTPQARQLKSHHHEVKVVEAPNDSLLVVKCFRSEGLGGLFRWKSPAHRAFNNARRLRHNQADTPTPICYIDQRTLGLLRTSYYVQKFRNQDTCEVLQNHDYPDAENILTALVRHFMRLHANGILLGRPSLSDILLERWVRTEKGFKALPRWNADGTPTPEGTVEAGTRIHYHFVLLGTHRVKVHKVKPTQRQCLNDLSHLTSNKKLLGYIVALYARERNWDDAKCAKKVTK